MAHRRLLPDNKGLYNLGKLYFVPKPHALNDGRGKDLPAAYKRYYLELNQKPAAVHHIPETRKFVRNPESGVVVRVQDDPPEIIYPKAFHKGLWGGAGIVKGYTHKHLKLSRMPRYWNLKFETSVVYSEVLDLFITTVVNKRAIQLIHKHYGFDHYLLQTPACDLKSDFALKVKRNILLALDKKELPHEDPEKREQVYNCYKHYLEKYDSEYIKWYGLQIHEAILKMETEKENSLAMPQPLKHLYRQEFLQELKSADANQVNPEESENKLTSFIQKWNPFKKS